MKKLEEMIAVMQAAKDGAEIEIKGYSGLWNNANPPRWDWVNYDYRIKPVELIPDFIDVVAVHGDYKWMARDDNGEVMLYHKRPRWNAAFKQWIDTGNLADIFASLKIGTVAPEDSLLDLDAMRKERGLL